MLMVGKALESLQRVCSGEISPHREQKELALPLLARLYINVGPMIVVGGSSRKMGIRCKNCTLAELSSQQNRKPVKQEKAT
jgi:hypothetical protein